MQQDASYAIESFQQACDGGYTQGCARLAWILQTCEEKGAQVQGCFSLIWKIPEKFNGILQYPTRIAGLYQQGCNGGDAASCFRLGQIYEKGKVIKNENLRKSFIRKSCNQVRLPRKLKSSDSCTMNMLMGKAPPQEIQQDIHVAKEYYGKACDLGNQRGCNEYARLNK